MWDCCMQSYKLPAIVIVIVDFDYCWCLYQVDSMYEGKTALHVAIEEGSPSAVRLLLEYKANMNLQVHIQRNYKQYLQWIIG